MNRRSVGLALVALLFAMPAMAQDGASFFYGGNVSFESIAAADAEDGAERATRLAGTGSVLLELSDNLYVGGQVYVSDGGPAGDSFTFDPTVLYLLGSEGTRPYLSAGLMDITDKVSYQAAAGVLVAPFGGDQVFLDMGATYRRLQGEVSDGDRLALFAGFRLHN